MQLLELSEFIAPPPLPASIRLRVELVGRPADLHGHVDALVHDCANYAQAARTTDSGFARLWSSLQGLAAEDESEQLYGGLWAHVDRLEAWEGATRDYLDKLQAQDLQLRPGLGPELVDLALRARRQRLEMLEAMEQYAQRLQHVRVCIESFVSARAPRERREPTFRSKEELESYLRDLEDRDA